MALTNINTINLNINVWTYSVNFYVIQKWKIKIYDLWLMNNLIFVYLAFGHNFLILWSSPSLSNCMRFTPCWAANCKCELGLLGMVYTILSADMPSFNTFSISFYNYIDKSLDAKKVFKTTFYLTIYNRSKSHMKLVQQ